MHHVAIGAVIATAAILVSVAIPFLLRALGLKNSTFTFADGKIALIEWIFLAFCFGVVSYLFSLLGAYQSLGVILLGLACALVPSFNFVLRPFLTSIQNKLEFPPEHIAERARREFGTDIELRVHSGALANAYAVGVLPTSKTIVLGEPLVEKLGSDETYAIIAHEVGHLRMNHLPLIYLTNVVCVAAFGLAMNYLYGLDMGGVGLSFLIVGGAGSVGGALFFSVIPGLLTRKLEYDADRFAVQKVGRQCYKNAFLKLAEVMGENLSKGDMAHPPLKKRLQHIGASYEDAQTERPAA